MPRVVRTEVEVSFKFILEPGGNVSASDQIAFQRTLALFRELQGVPNVTMNGALPTASPSHGVRLVDTASPDPEAVQRANRTCRHCGRAFDMPRTRSQHEGKCGAPPPAPLAIAEAAAVVYPCQYCGKSMGTVGSRYAHEAGCRQHPRNSWPPRGAHLTAAECRFCGEEHPGLGQHETRCFKRRNGNGVSNGTRLGE